MKKFLILFLSILLVSCGQSSETANNSNSVGSEYLIASEVMIDTNDVVVNSPQETENIGDEI